ncbi:hypothetical protein MJ561_19440 [Klebsiella pneumoniae]|nr:hypothetical protein MJ561_19440 [Klebsiella pneumoniae]
MLQTTLNGMIFLMLGEQLPRMLRDAAGGSQAGVSSPVSAAVRRSHHPGARSDALRLGMVVDEADNFRRKRRGQGHHRPSTLQYPRRHGAGGR